MKKYITTNGRIGNFKLGAVNIRVGKKPVAIADEHAQMIMRDYKGWIKLAPGEEPTVEEVKLPEAPTEATEATVDESKLPTDTTDNSESAGVEEVKPQELTTDNSETVAEESIVEEVAPVAAPKKVTKKATTKTA